MLAPFDAVVLVLLAVVLAPVVVLSVVLARYLGLWGQFRHLGRQLGARWWDAAGPLVLVTGVVVVASLRGDLPGEGDPGYLAFLVSAAAIFVGLVATTLAVGNLDEYRQTAGDADAAGTIDEGPVLVSGTASERGETPTAPLSGEPALCYVLRVTETRGWGHRKAPVEVCFEREGVPFDVDDGTGTVTVDPTDATLRFWGTDGVRTASRTVDPDEDLPPGVAAAYDRADLAHDEERTVTERRLPPETEVTALGTAARDPEARHPVVRDGDRRLAVFPNPLADVRSALRRTVKLGGLAGVACLALGSAGVFLTAGVV